MRRTQTERFSDILYKKFETKEWEREVKFWNLHKIIFERDSHFHRQEESLESIFVNGDVLRDFGIVFKPLNSVSVHVQKHIVLKVENLANLSRLDLWQIAENISYVVSVPAQSNVELVFRGGTRCGTNIFFLIGKGSHVSVFEDDVSAPVLCTSSNPHSFHSRNRFLFQDKGSELEYFFAPNVKGNVHFLFAQFLGALAKSSCYAPLNTLAMMHGTVVSLHEGKGSEANIVSTLHARGSSRVYLRFINTHNHGKSFGDICFRGLAFDETVAQADGLIEIPKKASGVASTLSEHFLVLSQGAMVKAIPKLEIMNNDVIASHSASIGSLDSDNLYYLMSRGLDRDMARKILVKGFVENILTSVRNQDMKKRFSHCLKLYGNNKL